VGCEGGELALGTGLLAISNYGDVALSISSQNKGIGVLLEHSHGGDFVLGSLGLFVLHVALAFKQLAEVGGVVHLNAAVHITRHQRHFVLIQTANSGLVGLEGLYFVLSKLPAHEISIFEASNQKVIGSHLEGMDGLLHLLLHDHRECLSRSALLVHEPPSLDGAISAGREQVRQALQNCHLKRSDFL